MDETPASDIEQSYDDFERIEALFGAALDESLQPRGTDVLYDLVATMRLPEGAHALDLGCGRGRHTLELARRFSLRVLGVDPVRRQVEQARDALREAAKRDPSLAGRVRFEQGDAARIPLDDASSDFIWCREVVVLIHDLDAAFAECRRVLRPGAGMLLEGTLATPRLEPHEAELLRVGGAISDNTPERVAAAMTRAGFTMERELDLAGQWGERAQELDGAAGRRLLHAARLLREPQGYVERFGRANYDVMLADCLWHVYRMIGKLGTRVYVARNGAA